ncbi:zinc finger protein 597, partial [Bos taurus]|uniref:zinc finger protein 597 n=1 Tax=Bos taurus TaxID=9913 RepID=UPI0028CB17A2
PELLRVYHFGPYTAASKITSIFTPSFLNPTSSTQNPLRTPPQRSDTFSNKLLPLIFLAFLSIPRLSKVVGFWLGLRWAVLLFQGPVLFEDLAVYFSQEECASLHPAQRSLSGEVTQECFEDKALSAENDKIEINQLLHLESMGLEELALEKCSLAVPLIYYQEKCSEHGAGNFERKISGGISACKKRFRSLLVTIENHTPKIELAQSLRTRALPKILPFPKEETKKSYKCPECDQSFSGSSYLVWHQKTHVGKKKCECDDCGKIFNHRSNLRAHRRIHTGEKPYKCFLPVWSAAQCGSSFHQPSHLSQHRKTHLKEKIHRCGICGRGLTQLRGLSQHQKTHTATKAGDKYVSQKTNLALPEEKHR